MARLASEPVYKQVKCRSCESIIEYLPEDVKIETSSFWDGSNDSSSTVKCPRPGCPGRGIVK